MKFKKLKVKHLNHLLTKVRDNREEFVEALINVCPKNGECDPQLEKSKEAMNCEYFTLCNAMGSYSLMSEADQAKADEVLDILYKKIESGKKLKEYFA